MKKLEDYTPEQLRDLPIEQRSALVQDWIKRSKKRTIVGALIWGASIIGLMYILALLS